MTSSVEIEQREMENAGFKVVIMHHILQIDRRD
jgi:hypothetical protein